MIDMRANIDPQTVKGFGDEWTRFDQSALSENELRELFDQYFYIFPWHVLPPQAIGFDVGCGSGRWAKFVAREVHRLHCIDASAAAVAVARRNLHAFSNCEFHLASVDCLPFEDNSMDFGYSIGVLHHVPDTEGGIRSCVAKLKAGGPFLLYLYYAFDNRPVWFRMLWRITNLARKGICIAPPLLTYWVSQAIAGLIYYPLARLSLVLELIGVNVAMFPLSYYRRRSFYTMRTDALDRFGTSLEKRFTSKEIRQMMERAGLERITFSHSEPFWCALGYKRQCVG